MVGFRYATDTSHPHSRPARRDATLLQRKNRPPVGLEVRKATRDISHGLDSANIYADSARGSEYFDVTLFIIRVYMFFFSYYIITIVVTYPSTLFSTNY